MGEEFKSPIGTVIWNDIAHKDDYNKYTVRLAFDADTDLSQFETQCDELTAQKWPKKVPATFKHPIVDGDDITTEDGEPYEWTAGKKLIRFSSTRAFKLVGPLGGNDVADAEDFYNGCTARVICDGYAYDKKGNKGVSFGARMIQFCDHGNRIGGSTEGRIKDEDAFDAVSGTKDAPFG